VYTMPFAYNSVNANSGLMFCQKLHHSTGLLTCTVNVHSLFVLYCTIFQEYFKVIWLVNASSLIMIKVPQGNEDVNF